PDLPIPKPGKVVKHSRGPRANLRPHGLAEILGFRELQPPGLGLERLAVQGAGNLSGAAPAGGPRHSQRHGPGAPLPGLPRPRRAARIFRAVHEPRGGAALLALSRRDLLAARGALAV